VFKLEELSWPQLEALDRAHTVIFIPISPVEEHGPHLPLGTDMYTCLGFIEAIAARLEQQHPELTTVLVPITPLGSGTAPYLGSIGVPPRMVQDVLLRMGRALARDGFRYIVTISGHLALSQLMTMERTAHKISKRYGIQMFALGAGVFHSALRSPELLQACAELSEPISKVTLESLARTHHAGALETSLMLHLRPDLVQPGFRQLEPISPWRFVRWRGWTREHWPGYIGEPAQARADLGCAVLAAAADCGADLVARIVAGDTVLPEEVAPLTRGTSRMVFRASLALGVVSLVSALVGVGFRWRNGGIGRQKAT
jgi:creatinine amidohydrolase